jgi:hypothetical protein
MMDEKKKSTLQIIGVLLGIAITAGTVLSGLTSFAAKLAERDFITIPVAKERDALLQRTFEQRIAVSEALAAQREAALVQRIEALSHVQEDANARMQTSIDRISNLLLQRR